MKRKGGEEERKGEEEERERAGERGVEDGAAVTTRPTSTTSNILFPSQHLRRSFKLKFVFKLCIT